MVYLPIKPVDVVNIAFLFINFFLTLSVLPMLVWEEHLDPQAEKNKHLFEE
jgi:hypothetical protein